MSIIKSYAAKEAGADLELFEYDAGELGQEDVEVQVDYCGICHSDLSMIDNEWGFSQYPLVAGHEVIGRVVALGDMAALAQQLLDVLGLPAVERAGLGKQARARIQAQYEIGHVAGLYQAFYERVATQQ